MQREGFKAQSYSSMGETNIVNQNSSGGATSSRNEESPAVIGSFPSTNPYNMTSNSDEIPETATASTTTNGESTEISNCFYQGLRNFKLGPFVFKLLVFVLLPLWLWLSSYVVFESDDLPGGSVFVIIVLCCGGRLLGYAAQFVRLPPMIGMLGLGLLIRNVPYIGFGKDLNPLWSAPIRQTALAVILTRAGLGLDLNVLIRLKALIFRFAILPTVVEATSIAIIAHLILDFPWGWGFLLGFVIAPVSPAVVVPRLLELREAGYGVEKGISTFIIASACLDNVLAISLFGVTLNFVFPEGSLAFTIIQGPLQVVLGLTFGLLWGGCLGFLFSQDQVEDQNVTLLRVILTFGGGVISVIGFSKLGYSGGGALGCLLASFFASCIWRVRRVFNGTDPLCWCFYILWFVFEPLLFGVIGCQIDILSLDLNVVYLGICCICVGSCVRFMTSLLVVTKANLTIKEKLFSAIAWIAKATVQAAIGPISLDMAKSRGSSPEYIRHGENVLTLAVLSILLTAVIGELGVIIAGPRFLDKRRRPSEIA